MKGKQIAQGLERGRVSNVEAGITGDPAKTLLGLSNDVPNKSKPNCGVAVAIVT